MKTIYEKWKQKTIIRNKMGKTENQKLRTNVKMKPQKMKNKNLPK